MSSGHAGSEVIIMNTSTLTDSITDRVPSRASAASTLSSALGDVSEHLPDLPDLSRTRRRTRRTVAKYVPGMSRSRMDSVRDRASGRWLLIAAVVITLLAVVVVLRRRGDDAAEHRRDDWEIRPSHDGTSATHEQREKVNAQR